MDVPGLVEELKAVFEHHKGEADVHLAIAHRRGGADEATSSATATACAPAAACGRSSDHVLGPDSLAA